MKDLIFTEITIIIVMLFLNGVFAAYELALTSLSLGKIKMLAEKGVKGSIAALHMKERQEASLAIIQIGVTFFGFVMAALGGAESESYISPYIREVLNCSPFLAQAISILCTVIPLSAISITIGELVPKTLALKHNTTVCLMLSPTMKGISYILYPAVLIFESLTKFLVKLVERQVNISNEANFGILELTAHAKNLRTERIISSAQEKIIIGASNLLKTKVKDIMISAEDIVTININEELPEVFSIIHVEAYTRFPVTKIKNDPQSIIGYVNIKEIIFLAKNHPESPHMNKIIRPVPSFVSETNISEAFSGMMKEHLHLALVRDANDKILGMVTLEDILEEVIGDVEDEFDRLPKHIISSGEQYIVGGGVSMSTVFKKLNISWQEEEQNSDINFSHWIKLKTNLKKIKSGEVIKIENFSILIRKVRRNHIFESLLKIEKE